LYNPQGLIPAWPIAFRPKTIVFNGRTHHTGLVEGGLKKGHKIRFVAPSPYCYDTRASDKVPANSPLVFTIEVQDIR
jgi:FKBP-type peptidyl-prolyl cis-trans isomerase FkpA